MHERTVRTGETGPRAQILVVDDDPEIRQMIRWALESDGFSVETAADGPQALDALARPRPAVIILDVTLPTMDGYQVADALRAQWDDVPVLMITADGSPVEKARRMGAYDYVKKPFDIEAFLAAVQRGLRP